MKNQQKEEKKPKGAPAPSPKRTPEENAPMPKRERQYNSENVSQLVPIVLVVLALLFLVSFVFTGMNESGIFGKIFGNLLYGLFSLPAWLIPPLLCYFAAVYRKESNAGTLGMRIAMTFGVFLTFLCIYFYFTVGIGGKEFSLSPVAIWQRGRDFSGSGLVGSYLGYLIFRIFGKVGTPIVLFPLFAILMVFLFGFTPREAYVYFRALIRQFIEKCRAKKGEKPSKGQAPAPSRSFRVSQKPAAPQSRDTKDNDVLFGATGKKEKSKNHDIEIDFATGEVFEEPKSDPIPMPTIRQYGVVSEAPKAKEMDVVAELQKLDEEQNEKPKIAPVVPKATPAPAPAVTTVPASPAPSAVSDDPSMPDVDLVALLEQSRKESVGGAFSHPESESEPEQPALPEKKPYEFPPEHLLKSKPPLANEDISEELNTNAYKLVETLRSFKVRTKVINVSRGPTITRYELAPEEGVRVRAISNLIDDIALNLATTGVRIEAPIPGKAAVGVEVPNKRRETVYLRDLIANDTFRSASAKLTVAVGMDVAGDPVYMDLAKLPHLLIAGTTGSGKSVCMNCLILSLLYKADPEEVKMIMIDPKKVEFSIYNGLPHLITPVVSSAKKAAGALSWAVNEMERRYELIETVGVRDIKSYNNITKDDPTKEFMPQLVIIIDELADLMMTAPGDVEESICRIAQKGRASGMHLIVGTQRPSVDVITGLIKANIPSRIAFTVSSQMDSRTIIDGAGAEKLIGRGDMLFAPIGLNKPIRVQGAFVSDPEVESIVEHVISHSGETVYDDSVMRDIEKEAELCGSKKKGGLGEEGDGAFGGGEGSDPMLRAAIELAVEAGKISTSLIQRRLSLGYGRAAKLIDQMQDMGIVGPQEGQKPRNVLITAGEWAEMVMREKDGQ